MSRRATMAFGAALVFTPAWIFAQTPQPAQSVNSNRQTTPANPRNPGGNNSGYNGSQTGVTDAAATVGAATDNNSQSTNPSPGQKKANANSGAYNGSQTGVTSGAGTIEAAPPNAQNLRARGSSNGGGRTTTSAGPNFTGAWSLNVAKSSWGKKAKPQSVVVNVQQSQPELKYSGTTTDTDGNQTTFDLDAAIDAREHSVKTSYGPGKITLKRINAYTVTSDFHSDDGKFTETATTAVSHDGRTLTRRVRTKGPDGDASWTEVYDRK